MAVLAKYCSSIVQMMTEATTIVIVGHFWVQHLESNGDFLDSFESNVTSAVIVATIDGQSTRIPFLRLIHKQIFGRNETKIEKFLCLMCDAKHM